MKSLLICIPPRIHAATRPGCSLLTMTDHGIGSSLFAMPIINQPQCGILWVGVLQKRAIVVSDTEGNDSIAICPMVYLSFVFDHRILDGASADAFLMSMKKGLEEWGG